MNSKHRARGPLGIGAQTVIDTAHLTLLPYSPDQILALIERPERFEGLTGFPAADGLRGFLARPPTRSLGTWICRGAPG